MMRKDFFDVVFSPNTPLPSNALLGVERSKFFAVMEEEQGLKTSALYNRLFNLGFDAWMLEGVDAVKDEFAVDYPELAAWRNSKSSFYALVRRSNAQLAAFYAFMRKKGMMSLRTTMKRFKEDKWKPWEKRGMKVVLQEYCDRMA